MLWPSTLYLAENNLTYSLSSTSEKETIFSGKIGVESRCQSVSSREPGVITAMAVVVMVNGDVNTWCMYLCWRDGSLLQTRSTAPLQKVGQGQAIFPQASSHSMETAAFAFSTAHAGVTHTTGLCFCRPYRMPEPYCYSNQLLQPTSYPNLLLGCLDAHSTL